MSHSNNWNWSRRTHKYLISISTPHPPTNLNAFVGHGKGKPEERHCCLRDRGLLLIGQIIHAVDGKVISWEINIIT